MLDEGTELLGFPQHHSWVFASKAETKNKITATKFVADTKEIVLFLIIGRDLIQEDLDDIQGGYFLTAQDTEFSLDVC